MKKILLIEKNEGIRSNLAQVLQLINFEVHQAKDGHIAIELISQITPDVILCDSLLPVMEGFSFMQQLQSNPATKEVKIMFYTPSVEYDITQHFPFINLNGFSNGHNHMSNSHQAKNDIIQNINELIDLNGLNGNIKSEHVHTNNSVEIEQKHSSPQSIIDTLIKDRDVIHYGKKQMIYQEGNNVRSLYFIKKGKIKTYQMNDYGKQLVLDLYTENDFLGYVPILENTNYTENAEALEETELILIPKVEFYNLIKNNNDAIRLFVNMLTRNIDKKNNQLVGLAYNSLRKKVAEALVVVFKKYNNPSEKDVLLNINRECLATIAGTATESLIRTLSDFKGEKLIDVKNNSIRILDIKKLEAIM